MCTKHTTSVRHVKGYNACKMSYAPLLSSLIIFCETLYYLNGNSLCVIKNDSIQRRMYYALVKQRLGQQGEANLRHQYHSVNKSM